MLVGYMRVSTGDQCLDLQADALRKAGCERIFEDVASGSSAERPGLDQCLAFLREGQDTLVVWRLDRLGRSLPHLISIVGELGKRAVGFRSVQENLDTTSSMGRLVFHMFGALAEFERDVIKDRTMAGLQAARARGRLGGRPKKLTQEKERAATTLLNSSSCTIKEISQQLGVSPSTLYHFHARRKNKDKECKPEGSS